MDPNVWGPKLWFVIHSVALNYPQNPTYDDKRHYEEFFNNLVFMIPCEKCKNHYKQRLLQNHVTNHLTSTQKLFKYTVDLHNDVNKSLKKRKISYNEAYKIYINAYTKNPHKIHAKSKIKNLFNKIFSKKMLIIYILIILIVLGYLYYRKNTFYRVIKV